MSTPTIFTTPSKKREPISRGEWEEIVTDGAVIRRVVARYLAQRREYLER